MKRYAFFLSKSRGVKEIQHFSDNGTHFHSAINFSYQANILQDYGIKFTGNFFPPGYCHHHYTTIIFSAKTIIFLGEGKSDMDRYFGRMKLNIQQELKSGLVIQGNTIIHLKYWTRLLMFQKINRKNRWVIGCSSKYGEQHFLYYQCWPFSRAHYLSPIPGNQELRSYEFKDGSLYGATGTGFPLDEYKFILVSGLHTLVKESVKITISSP